MTTDLDYLLAEHRRRLQEHLASSTVQRQAVGLRAFDEAARVCREVVMDWGFVDVRGLLCAPSTAKLALLCVDADQIPVVLKVNGISDDRRQGKLYEGEVLRKHRRGGALAPMPIREGIFDNSSGVPAVQALLTAYVPGRPLSSFVDVHTRRHNGADLFSWAAKIARELRYVHQVSCDTSDREGLLHVSDEVQLEYQKAYGPNGPLRSNSDVWPLVRDINVLSLLRTMREETSEVVLHGDVAAANVQQFQPGQCADRFVQDTSSGRIMPSESSLPVLIDPAGSYGNREFDLARLVVRFNSYIVTGQTAVSGGHHGSTRELLRRCVFDAYETELNDGLQLDMERYAAFEFAETINAAAWKSHRLGLNATRSLLVQSRAFCHEVGLGDRDWMHGRDASVSFDRGIM